GFYAFPCFSARLFNFNIRLMHDCSGICQSHFACLASLRLRIHFFSSSSRVTGDRFPFFFATRAPISRQTSLRFPCEATESCLWICVRGPRGRALLLRAKSSK